MPASENKKVAGEVLPNVEISFVKMAYNSSQFTAPGAVTTANQQTDPSRTSSYHLPRDD